MRVSPTSASISSIEQNGWPGGIALGPQGQGGVQRRKLAVAGQDVVSVLQEEGVLKRDAPPQHQL